MQTRIIIPLLALICCTVSARATEAPLIPGWQAKGALGTYDINTVSDAINGAAELHIDYGFRLLMTQQYERDGVVVALQIFDQSSVLNAFGLYKREQPPGALSLAAGAEAIAAVPHYCMLYKGQFYVRAEAIGGELTPRLCQQLLAATARTLSGSDCAPAALSRLPAAGRLPGSQRFTRRSYLGLSELSSCLHAKYAIGSGSPIDLFLIVEEDNASVNSIWEALQVRWQQTTVAGLPALHRKVPYRGQVVVVKTAQGILGTVSAAGLKAAAATLKHVLR